MNFGLPDRVRPLALKHCASTLVMSQLENYRGSLVKVKGRPAPLLNDANGICYMLNSASHAPISTAIIQFDGGVAARPG